MIKCVAEQGIRLYPLDTLVDVEVVEQIQYNLKIFGVHYFNYSFKRSLMQMPRPKSDIYCFC